MKKYNVLLVIVYFSLLPFTKGQSLPIGAQPSGYDVYSTNEVLTTKVWIDGKLIYRKVVELGYFPNSAIKQVLHGLTNVTFTSVTGIGWGNGYSFNLPFTYFSPYEISIQVNGANVEVRTTSNFAITYNGYAILEYTKN